MLSFVYTDTDAEIVTLLDARWKDDLDGEPFLVCFGPTLQMVYPAWSRIVVGYCCIYIECTKHMSSEPDDSEFLMVAVAHMSGVNAISSRSIILINKYIEQASIADSIRGEN